MRALLSARWIGVAVAAAGLALLVAAQFVLRHTWNGDASIYLPYARNAWHGDFFSFNPHEFSSGSTSPLWGLLLALPVGIAPGTAALKVFFAGMSGIAYAATFAAAVRATGSWIGAALGTLFVVTTLTVPAALGFESPLVVAVVAASVWFAAGLVGDRPLTVRSVAPLCIAWALLPLSRPEAALLIPVEGAALWLGRGRGRADLRALAIAAVVAAIPAAAYYGYSLAKLGVPSTSAAGRAEWLRDRATHVGPLYLSDYGLRYLFTSPIIFAFVPALVGLVLLARERARRPPAALALGGIAVYVLLLTFVTPGFLDTQRYLLPIAPFVAIGIAAWVAVAPRRRYALLASACVAAAFVGLPAVNVLRKDATRLRDQPYSFDNNLETGASRVLNAKAARDSTVLAYEVQVRWGLRSDLRVLSLDGITDGKILPYLRRHDVDGFLMRYRPRYWVADPTADPPAPGARDSAYRTGSALGRAMARLRADTSLKEVTESGIRFRVLARRPGPLPYRFGPWTAVLELSYPPASG